jgi:membrane protein implicated in regulation of membrane protease activity
VLIGGELWQAVAEDGPVAAGEVVRVARMDGLTLTVTRSTRRA